MRGFKHINSSRPTLAQLVEHMTVVVTEEIMWSLVRI